MSPYSTKNTFVLANPTQKTVIATTIGPENGNVDKNKKKKNAKQAKNMREAVAARILKTFLCP